MSRGLGSLQRSALAVLDAAECRELPVRTLRRRLGDPDRSNLRRGIQSLLRRGHLEEIEEGVGSRLKLTFWGMMAAYLLFRAPGERLEDPTKEVRHEWDEFRCWLIEGKREERRLRDEKRALYPEWVGYDYRPVRSPGSTQRTVLRALWDCSDPLDAGLSVLAVKRIIGGDRSNVRRAVRGLISYGYLHQTPDGERLRISEALLRDYAMMMLPAAPIKLLTNAPDEEWVRQVLREQEEELPVVVSGDDCRENGEYFARKLLRDRM